MQQNILIKIQQQMENLPHSERKIAEIVTTQPLEIINMSAAELAEEANSSPAAVIRFCRSIGLKGFIELKLMLSAVSNDLEERIYTDILPDESLDQIKKKLLWHTSFTFEKTNESLVNERLEAAVNLIVNSPTIYVYGLGASYLVAMDLKQKLTRIGKAVICSQDQHELAAIMAVAQKDSVYFGISNSGEKKEGLVIMDVAKKWGLHTIALTKDTDNRLSRLADISLQTADTNEAPLRSGATTSLLSQMYAIDVLFYHFMTKRYQENVQNLGASRKATDDLNIYYEKYYNSSN